MTYTPDWAMALQKAMNKAKTDEDGAFIIISPTPKDARFIEDLSGHGNHAMWVSPECGPLTIEVHTGKCGPLTMKIAPTQRYKRPRPIHRRLHGGRWNKLRRWRTKAERAQVQNYKHRLCQHPGCKAIAMPCFVPSYDWQGWVESGEWFCSDHAAQHLYCTSCGCLMCDMQSIEGQSMPGLCGECSDLIREELRESRDYDARYEDDDYTFDWDIFD